MSSRLLGTLDSSSGTRICINLTSQILNYRWTYSPITQFTIQLLSIWPRFIKKLDLGRELFYYREYNVSSIIKSYVMKFYIIVGKDHKHTQITIREYAIIVHKLPHNTAPNCSFTFWSTSFNCVHFELQCHRSMASYKVNAPSKHHYNFFHVQSHPVSSICQYRCDWAVTVYNSLNYNIANTQQT